MNPQNLRLFSILAALLAGLWLPLKLTGIALPFWLEVSFDVLVSIASLINVRLFFQKGSQGWKSPGLALDFICVLPLTFIDFALVDPLTFPLVVFKLAAVRHVLRIKTFLDSFADLQPVAYRLIPIGLLMPLLVHMVACCWVALGSGTAGPDPDPILEYIRALYWSFTTLTTVGYGDIAAKTAPQMLFASGVQVLGVGVFGFVISNVAGLLSRRDAAREHHMDNLDKVETYLRSHKIPSELRGKIRHYYHYLWTHHKGYSDHTLLEGLPGKIQSELFLFVNKAIIDKVSFLQGASTEMIEDLMHELEPRIVVPGEKLFRIQDHGDCMYLIHRGQIEILDQNENVLATLNEGAFFGEMALLSEKPRMAAARAVTYCDVYALHKDSFHKVKESHPEFKAHIEKVTAERTQKRTG